MGGRVRPSQTVSSLFLADAGTPAIIKSSLFTSRFFSDQSNRANSGKVRTMAQVHGKAGTAACRKGDHLVQQATIPVLSMGILTYLFFRFGMGYHGLRELAYLVCLAGGFFCCAERVYHLEIIANRYYNGAGGEWQVSSALAQLPDEFHVFNGLGFYAGDVDHVVVGPTGVFVIETKSYVGAITLKQGHLCRNGDMLQRDFVKQATSEAMYVKSRLQPQSPCHVRPLVVFTKAHVRIHTAVDGVRIIPMASLCEIILERAPCLSDEEIAVYAGRLAGVSTTSAEIAVTPVEASPATAQDPRMREYGERPGFLRLDFSCSRQNHLPRARRKTRRSLNSASSSRRTACAFLEGSKARGVSRGGEL